MSNTPKSVPVWLIVLLAVGGVLFLSCCVLPCVIGSFVSTPVNSEVKQAAVPDETESKEEELANFLKEVDRVAERIKEGDLGDLRIPEEPVTDEARYARVEAWAEAMQFLKDREKPSTVLSTNIARKDLPDYQDPDTCVTKQADGSFLVQGRVDVKNVSGETTRFDFVMSIRPPGEDAVSDRWAMNGEPTFTLAKQQPVRSNQKSTD